MTQTPAGWYADPDPSYAGPGRLRYWDGQRWTEHVHQMAPPAPVPLPTYPDPHTPRPEPIASGQQYPGYAGPPAYGYQAPTRTATTPDGQRLAGWWQRVAALLIDGVILVPVYVLAAVPLIASQWDELSAWFDDLDAAAQNDTALPSLPDLFDPTSAEALLLGLTSVGIALVYNAAFLRWKQATPGKLLLGLRVRRRDTPGPLPWSTVLVRVGAVTGLSVVMNLPWIGLLAFPVVLLNYLWPLWDPKKQTLHDKVAGTNVVRLR